MNTAALFFSMWLCTASWLTPIHVAKSEAAPKTFGRDGRNLQSIRRNILENGSSVATAVAKIRRAADHAMQERLHAITDKNFQALSRHEHDYFILLTYFWPNPNTANGLPYVLRDGEDNPENENFDNGRLRNICQKIKVLTQVYYFTGQESYAERTAQQSRRWFLNPDTRANPNLKYALCVWPDLGGLTTHMSDNFVTIAPGTAVNLPSDATDLLNKKILLARCICVVFL